MNNASGQPDVNPFTSRQLRPGAIPFIFANGQSPAPLVARLAAANWRGQIIGPHGSGKSTLLVSLLPEITAAGREPRLITLHNKERRLPRESCQVSTAGAHTVLVIDGYEQLAYLERWRLHRTCQQQCWGLLITAHERTRLPFVSELPVLYQTAVTLESASRVLTALVGPEQAESLRPLLSEKLRQHAGNLREVLFELYDMWELDRRRRSL